VPKSVIAYRAVGFIDDGVEFDLCHTCLYIAQGLPIRILC
jgi:hypothetical protein